MLLLRMQEKSKEKEASTNRQSMTEQQIADAR